MREARWAVAGQRLLAFKRMNPRSLTLGLAVLLFFLMRHSAIDYVDSRVVVELFQWLRVAGIVVSFVVYVRLVGWDLFGSLCSAMGCCICFSYVLNGVPLWYFASQWGAPIASALLVRAVAPRRPRETLWAMCIVCSTVSVLNLISIILSPGGLSWLPAGVDMISGGKNSSIIYILPSVMCSCLLDSLSDRRLSARSVLLFAIGVAQVTLEYSSTSLVALGLIALVMLADQVPRVRSLLNMDTYLVLFFTFFVAIVVFRFQGVAEPFIQGALGKDLTFTGRTYVWDDAIRRVIDTNILFGCGNDGGFFNGVGAVGSAHNMIVGLFVQGGALGVACFVALLVAVSRHLTMRPESWSVAVVSLTIAAFLVLGMMEVTRWVSFFYFLGLGCCWNEILSAEKVAQRSGKAKDFGVIGS